MKKKQIILFSIFMLIPIGITFLLKRKKEGMTIPKNNNQRTWREIALDLLVKFEGFISKPYPDHKQWSIGYGSYAGDLSKPPIIKSITKQEALKHLKMLIDKYYSAYVSGRLKVKLNDYQIAALVTYAYNYPYQVINYLIPAINRKAPTSELRLLWMQIVYASGKKNQGLVDRRLKEWEVYNTL